MRTKIEIFQDVTSAAATALSTDHFRALSGAEWLKQLASELAERVKAEAPNQTPEPPQAVIEPQESPGEGWRWLKPGEVIDQRTDEVKGGSRFFPVKRVHGYRVALSQTQTYRRRIV